MCTAAVADSPSLLRGRAAGTQYPQGSIPDSPTTLSDVIQRVHVSLHAHTSPIDHSRLSQPVLIRTLHTTNSYMLKLVPLGLEYFLHVDRELAWASACICVALPYALRVIGAALRGPKEGPRKTAEISHAKMLLTDLSVPLVRHEQNWKTCAAQFVRLGKLPFGCPSMLGSVAPPHGDYSPQLRRQVNTGLRCHGSHRRDGRGNMV